MIDAVQRLSHVGICVSDLERSLRFYRDLLGFVAEHELEMAGQPTDTLLRLRDSHLKAVYLKRDESHVPIIIELRQALEHLVREALPRSQKPQPDILRRHPLEEGGIKLDIHRPNGPYMVSVPTNIDFTA